MEMALRPLFLQLVSFASDALLFIAVLMIEKDL